MSRRKLGFIMLLLFIVIIAVAVYLWNSVERYTFSEKGFFPVLETFHKVSPGDTAVLDTDTGAAVLTLSDISDKLNGDGLCVYFLMRKAVLLTDAMIYFPYPVWDDKLLCYKLPCFTEVEFNGDNVSVSKENQLTVVDKGLFLFNGKDTYILLRSGKLTLGEEEISLSPLSYVIASKDHWVQYYDYESMEFKIHDIEDTKETIDISFEDCDFVIHAQFDKGSYKDKDYIFISAPDYLPEFLTK